MHETQSKVSRAAWNFFFLNYVLKIDLFGKNKQLNLCSLKNLHLFLMFAGRIGPSRGPHVARGPRVWDPCPRRSFWGKINRSQQLPRSCMIFPNFTSNTCSIVIVRKFTCLFEQSAQKIFPQFLQWCFLLVRVKEDEQEWQLFTSESSAHLRPLWRASSN